MKAGPVKAQRALVLALVLAVGVIGGLLAFNTPSQASSPGMLDFQTMAPVTGPYVGNAHPIRGIDGGGLPWIITSGQGVLSSTGHLVVNVHGLVLARAAPVPTNLQGTNPVSPFRAVVSCQTIDGAGQATVENVSTAPFPATSTGDAHVDTQVTLPHPCIAPIVFVTASNTGHWLASTGN